MSQVKLALTHCEWHGSSAWRQQGRQQRRPAGSASRGRARAHRCRQRAAALPAQQSPLASASAHPCGGTPAAEAPMLVGLGSWSAAGLAVEKTPTVPHGRLPSAPRRRCLCRGAHCPTALLQEPHLLQALLVPALLEGGLRLQLNGHSFRAEPRDLRAPMPVKHCEYVAVVAHVQRYVRVLLQQASQSCCRRVPAARRASWLSALQLIPPS